MAGSKAISYAEQTLGVHTTYEEAHQLANEAATLRQKIATMRRMKSAWEVSYLDAEYEFISDLRGANKDMSQTAFDKFAKVEVHRDASLRSKRSELAEEATKIERCEADLATLKIRCDIAVARLNELGGYFAYLASLKNAETLTAHGEAITKTMDRVESWPPDPHATV